MVETTEIAIKSMDSQLRDVLSDTPEADRGKLISACLKSIPNRMNFVEGVMFVSALSKMGILDINNITNGQIYHDGQDDNRYSILGTECNCIIDTDGRITQLKIQQGRGYYDLPAIIASLERLTCLTLFYCRSLPVELSNLPHLEKLHLQICSLDLFENFPIQMKLNNLKKLVVNSDVSLLPAISRLLKWMTSQLPSLETLKSILIKSENASFIIDYLRTNDVCFHNSLKHLDLVGCMEQESFEILMLEIVPKFRNLKSLNLWSNNIKSFLPIVDSIRNDRTFLPSKSLLVLDVYNGPVLKKMKDDPMEKAALLSFLGTFNTIQTFGASEVFCFDSDLEYALRINHAGRRIVVKVDGGSNTNNDDGKAIVPSSLWPIILERAYEKSLDISHPWDSKTKKKNATGIYYLLREVGPALLSGGRRRPNACILSKDGGEDVSLKRKDIFTINERVPKTRNNNNNKSSSSSSPSKRSCYGK